MGYVYVITNNINGKQYVGQTTKTVHERWKEHVNNFKKRNQPLYCSMKKYGIENFTIQVLESVPSNQSLDEKEIFYIKKLNTLLPNGYNATKGGSKFKDDNPMYHKEIASKVSKHFVGDKNPAKRPEVREKIKQSALGRKASDETKKKMSRNNGRYWAGKHLPEETRKKISRNHGMRGKLDEQNPWSKSVAQIDMDANEIIAIYQSMNGAIRSLVKNGTINHGSASHISSVCSGREKSAYGFYWKKID